VHTREHACTHTHAHEPMHACKHAQCCTRQNVHTHAIIHVPTLLINMFLRTYIHTEACMHMRLPMQWHTYTRTNAH